MPAPLSQTKMTIGVPAVLPLLMETIPAPLLTASLQAHLARVQPSVPTSFGSGALGPCPVLSWVPDSPESIPTEEGAALTTARDGDGTQAEETPVLQSFAGPWRVQTLC